MNKIQQHIKDSKRLFREKFLNIHGEPSFAMSKSAVEIVERFFSASQTSLIEKIVEMCDLMIKKNSNNADDFGDGYDKAIGDFKSILLEVLKEKI